MGRWAQWSTGRKWPKMVQNKFLGKFGEQKWSKPQILLSLRTNSPIVYESTGPEHSKYVRHVGVGGAEKFCVRTKNAKLVQIEFLGKFGAQKWSKPQSLLLM
jgi:hypothetical protein